MRFISGFVRRQLGVVKVDVGRDGITITGISKDAFFRDMYSRWGSNVISKWMFRPSNSYTLRVSNFFALDLMYILSELHQGKRVRTPKYTLDTILKELEKNTWLGNINKLDSFERLSDKTIKERLDKFAIHKPKDYQEEFIRHYLTMTKTLNLNGYMLDSAPGTGKTLTLLYLSQVLSVDGKKIFIVPKNAVKRVWEDTIKDLLIEDSPWWSSLSGKPLNEDYKFYILHYEYLEQFEAWFSQSNIKDKDVFVGLDESHNFNRMSSLRTQIFLDLCNDKRVSNVVWSSGTPISALGSECIPFLKCIDPYFDKVSEEAFAKIYGRDARRANDILRHRIGHLKFYVPGQEAGIVNVNIQEYMIEMPGSEAYLMDTISSELKDFANERLSYYKANFKEYREVYDSGIEEFKKSRGYIGNEREFARYVREFNTISKGYDPKLHKEEAKFVNEFELKVIIPNLNRPLNHEFKNARSVIKYVHLKVMGEALGKLSGYRSDCFRDMIPYSHLPEIIDGATKKTIIFTSYVDVVKGVGEYLENEGYEPILIYGDTNKNLAPLVKEFFDNPKLNPLVATFQSLSTAVPLIAANRIVNMNQPFRDNIKQQSIARAARLGQDTDVDVYDLLLDTKGKDNISTRNQDILEWSADMVKSIMGTSNVDLDSLAMESEVGESSLDTDDVTRTTTEPLPAYLQIIRYKGTMIAVGGLDELIERFNKMFGIVSYFDRVFNKVDIKEDVYLEYKLNHRVSTDEGWYKVYNPDGYYHWETDTWLSLDEGKFSEVFKDWEIDIQ